MTPTLTLTLTLSPHPVSADLAEAFAQEAKESGRTRLLLTAAVPVGPDTIRGGYDVPKLARSVHIMPWRAQLARSVQVMSRRAHAGQVSAGDAMACPAGQVSAGDAMACQAGQVSANDGTACPKLARSVQMMPWRTQLAGSAGTIGLGELGFWVTSEVLS